MQTPETGERDELNGLVRSARAGSRSDFDELVRRTYVDTYTLAVRLTRHEEDARDVVQEAYLRAWKGIRRFRGESQFATWMYRITANTAFTHIQRRTRLRTSALEDAPDIVEAAVDARPEDAYEAAAGLAELSEAVDRLPSSLRQIVILKDVYGLPHDAIAHELDISVAAAKVRLHRGRKKLRDQLDSLDGGRGVSQGRSARAV